MPNRRLASILATVALISAGCVLSTSRDCGRLDDKDCTDAVQVAGALLPSDFHVRRVVAELPCGPGEGCAAGWKVFVVFEPTSGDDLAFYVDRSDERIEAVAFPIENLPKHVAAMLR